MRVGSVWLPLIDIAQDRLEVDDRRSVDRLQAADLYAYPVEAQDSNAVQADRVGSARGPSAEDTLLSSGEVPSRMYGQDSAVGFVQPGQHDDLVANGNAIQARVDLRIQDQVRGRRALITLARCVGC